MRGQKPVFVHKLEAARSLVSLAGNRFLAHDFDGVAAALAPLMSEVSIAKNKEILPLALNIYSSSDNGTTLTKAGPDLGLLSHYIDNAKLPHASRIQAALGLARRLVSDNKLKQAVDTLRDLSATQPYSSSLEILAYLSFALVSLSHAPVDGHFPRPVLQSLATEALERAACLSPSTVAFPVTMASIVAETDLRHALSILRNFIASNEGDIDAHHALLLALRVAPESHSNFQEQVDLARHALTIDPTAKCAMELLTEAASWDWPVEPPVGQVEVANALAAAVEIKFASAEAAEFWTTLATALELMTVDEQRRVWHADFRFRWWPTHFFRAGAAYLDHSEDSRMADAKRRVSVKFMGEDNEYFRELASYTRVLTSDP